MTSRVRTSYVTGENVQQKVSRIKSWTGPDMIHTYWRKTLTALHEHLAAHPGWLTQGWMFLIPKDLQNRAMSCLTTTWKLLSGIAAARKSGHKAQYMSRAQKGISEDSRAEKQLLVDKIHYSYYLLSAHAHTSDVTWPFILLCTAFSSIHLGPEIFLPVMNDCSAAPSRKWTSCIFGHCDVLIFPFFKLPNSKGVILKLHVRL